jgi:hypothetical protein
MISRYNPDSMEGVTPPFSGIFALRPVTSDQLKQLPIDFQRLPVAFQFQTMNQFRNNRLITDHKTPDDFSL